MTNRVARKAPPKKPSSKIIGETIQADPDTFTALQSLVFLVEEVIVLGRRNIDGLVQSSAIIGQALEDIGRDSLDFGTSAGKAMMTTRSLHKMLAIRHKRLRDSLDKALIHDTKVPWNRFWFT